MKTCKTFDSAAEAAAFMMGYRLAKANCRIDPEEPQTILIDAKGKASDDYYEAILQWREEVRT